MISIQAQKTAASLLLFLSLAVTPLFATNGLAQIGHGVKAKGIGGAGIALPQDAFTSATNPAGLTSLSDRLDAGVHWMRPRGSLQLIEEAIDPITLEPVTLYPEYISNRNVIWPEVGAVKRIGRCEALGLSIWCFGGFDTLYNPRTTPVSTIGPIGRTNFGMEFKQFAITPSWAWKIGNQQSFGVAVNVVFAWTSVKGLEYLLGTELSGPPTVSETPAYASNHGTDHEEGISIRFGYLVALPYKIDLGLTYQTPTWINRFKNYKGFLAGRGHIDLPSEAGGGIAIQLPGCLRATCDLLYLMWTDARALKNSPDSEELFGSANGPGFGWRDQVVVRGGLLWQPLPCVTLRAGWNWGRAPSDARGIFLNALNLAFIEHHLTVGGTFRWGSNELSFSYVEGFSHRLRGENQRFPVHRLSANQYSLAGSYARLF